MKNSAINPRSSTTDPHHSFSHLASRWKFLAHLERAIVANRIAEQQFFPAIDSLRGVFELAGLTATESRIAELHFGRLLDDMADANASILNRGAIDAENT